MGLVSGVLSILALTASALAIQTGDPVEPSSVLNVHCRGVSIENSAKIEGQLTLSEDPETGYTVATGQLDLELKPMGHPEVISIDGLPVFGHVEVLEQSDFDGSLKKLRAIKIMNPGQDIAYILLSLDLPQLNSLVRTKADVQYRTNCQASSLEPHDPKTK